MKSLHWLVIGLVLIGALMFTINSKNKSCGTFYRTDKTIQVGTQIIKAEAVTTTIDLAKGLGGRSCINSDQAMLFIFDKPGQHSIWMKDMHFPIDIVWINQAKKVVKVATDILPSTYPEIFANSKLASYVLELKAGQAQSLGIKEGTTLNL